MSGSDDGTAEDGGHGGERAPGDDRQSVGRRVALYLLGYALAGALTLISFWVARTEVFWQPGVAPGLVVLAVAQMGIHLVFFLHLTSGPDNVNNALAVAFGTLIIVLVGAGSLWIMANLNANMAPMPGMTDLHLQR